MIRTIAIFAAATVSAACASSINQVPVNGSTTDMMQVAGGWAGEFKTDSEDVRATVNLRFAADRHTANAKVMVLDASPDGNALQVQVKELRVDNRRLTGTLVPYTDSSCDCVVQTEFFGDVLGDIIVGTYRTKTAGKLVTGQWSAQRVD